MPSFSKRKYSLWICARRATWPRFIRARVRQLRQPVFDDLPFPGGTETILLADEHDGIRELAHSVLKAKVYHVLLAQDGEEALAAFAAHRDRISLVLLGVIMPKRSGSELFAAIKALKPDASVLFATGYTNETAALADLVARGVAGLPKPYSPSALGWRVRAVLDAA